MFARNLIMLILLITIRLFNMDTVSCPVCWIMLKLTHE